MRRGLRSVALCAALVTAGAAQCPAVENLKKALAGLVDQAVAR